ncbi:MAG: RNA polymerase sigma-70 factor [Prolixibacteraceae bacterium]
MSLEKELLKSAFTGNKKAFEILFRKYYGRLCAYAASFVSQNETAEDLVTEVFLNLWEKKETVQINDSVSAYLFRSVRNSCLNYLTREKSRRLMVSVHEVTLHQIKMEYTPSENPPDRLMDEELRKKISEEIEKLPEQCREIFQLSRMEELSHKEIAKKLGISENTVKVQIYRALIKLRNGLKDYLPVLLLKFPDFF